MANSPLSVVDPSGLHGDKPKHVCRDSCYMNWSQAADQRVRDAGNELGYDGDTFVAATAEYQRTGDILAAARMLGMFAPSTSAAHYVGFTSIDNGETDNNFHYRRVFANGAGQEPWRIPMPDWASDPDVKVEFGRIWSSSRTDLPPSRRYEQGGWVVHQWWADEGDYTVIRVLPGLPHRQPWMAAPPSWATCLCTVAGSIHSHPLNGNDGPYDPFRPSDADLRHSDALGLPGVIVTFPQTRGDPYQVIPYKGP